MKLDVDERTGRLWLAIRQALIIAIGAIEEYLGMQRSIVPKHKRSEHERFKNGRVQRLPEGSTDSFTTVG